MPVLSLMHIWILWWNSLQDEMFQKFNFDTEWGVKLISKINDEDLPIEGHAIVNQVLVITIYYVCFFQ